MFIPQQDQQESQGWLTPERAIALQGLGMGLSQMAAGQPVNLSPAYQALEQRQQQAQMRKVMDAPGVLDGFTPQQRAVLATMPPALATEIISQRIFAQADPVNLQTVTGKDGALYSFNPRTGQLTKLQDAPAGGVSSAEIEALKWRAAEAGLQPGTPEYQDFIMNGGKPSSGSGPAAFEALRMQALAAGLIEGSPEYQQFMLTAGAGQKSQAAAEGKGAAESAAAAQQGLVLTEDALAAVDGLLSDPALGSISGNVQGRMPQAIMGTDQRRAMSRYNQIQGQSFLQARQWLKGQGAITDFESTKAEAAMARLDRAQSDEDFAAALMELKDVLQKGYARLSERAGGAPAQGATDDSDLFNKYGIKP